MTGKQLLKKYQGADLSKSMLEQVPELRRLDNYITNNDFVRTFCTVLHAGFGKTFSDLEHEVFLAVEGDTGDEMFALNVKEAVVFLVRQLDQPHIDFHPNDGAGLRMCPSASTGVLDGSRKH